MKLILWGAIAAQLLGNGVVLAQKTTPSTKAGIALAVLAGSNSPLQISGGDGALFTSDRGTVLEFHMMLSKPLSDQFSLITGACFGY
ncbi:MAG: hypothetical protein LC670_05580, partial [Flavobacteriales bacterium]|nr:hypothetical protein [Flavobacteriales bacterium]